MTAAEWWAAARRSDVTGAHIERWNALAPGERRRVEARIKVGLRHADAKVGAAAWRMAEHVLCAEWMPARPTLSRHLALEVAVAHWRGRPLPPRAPVPGCACATCATLAAGGDWTDAADVEAAVEVLAGLHPEPRQYPYADRPLSRLDVARELVEAARRRKPDAKWPRPEVLALLAAHAPGAVQEGERVEACACEGCASAPAAPAARRTVARRRWMERVERARAIPLAEVAARLGLERHPRRPDWARCPFHDDQNPSLHLNSRKARAYCNPCGRSWDAIELYREARRCTFREAVEELAP